MFGLISKKTYQKLHDQYKDFLNQCEINDRNQRDEIIKLKKEIERLNKKLDIAEKNDFRDSKGRYKKAE